MDPRYDQMDPLYDQISTYPCNVRTFSDPILYLAGLKTSCKYSPKKRVIYHRGHEMDFWSFIIQGVDAPVINTEPISVVHPSDVAKNIVDSHNIFADEGELSPIGPDVPSYLEEGKRSTAIGKRKFISQVNGLHDEYSRLILKEKKWINYKQTLSTLCAKVEGLRSEGKRL
nr:hypothetical protein [Tanacetum cinerariifolium]